VIELVLAEVAKGGREHFNLTWFHQQGKQYIVMPSYKDGLLPLATVRMQAKKLKRPVGPRLNKAILRTLDCEVSGLLVALSACTHHDIQAQSGFLCLQHNPNGLSIYMPPGGRHEYVSYPPNSIFAMLHHFTGTCTAP
jgi:hypothetical protein